MIIQQKILFFSFNFTIIFIQSYDNNKIEYNRKLEIFESQNKSFQ